jgi:hypothetical protein
MIFLISGKKITLGETHSSIQKFPNLFIYFQICQGGPQKEKTKNKKTQWIMGRFQTKLWKPFVTIYLSR